MGADRHRIRFHYRFYLALLLAAIWGPRVFVEGAVNVGDKPALEFTSLQGTQVSLSSLKGKIVVVDFWATWCGPCMREAPHMVQVNEKYSGQGMQIVGISLDNDPKAALRVAQQIGLNWPQACDGGGWGSAFARDWGVHSIPHTFIVGPDGTVLWAGHPAGLDEPLAEAFREHPPQLVDAAIMNKAQAQVERAAEELKSGSNTAAIQDLAQIKPEALKDGELAKQLGDVQLRAERAGIRMLVDAQLDIRDKQYSKAAGLMQTVETAFTGNPLGDEARGEIGEMEADPAAKDALATAGKEAEAERQLAAAEREMNDKNIVRAHDDFESVVQHYPGTEAAAKAKRTLSDPAFVDQVSSEASAQLFNLADSYHQSGRDDLAKAKLKTIVDQFPGSTYAAQAQSKIDAMGGGN